MLGSLIHGNYVHSIRTIRPPGLQCSNCGSLGQTDITKVAHVVHIWFVPLFPTRTFHQFDCTICAESADYSWPQDRNHSDFMNNRIRYLPIWLFSGPLLILIGVLLFQFNLTRENKIMEQRILDSQIGQIVEYETELGQFSSLRICGRKGDSLLVNYNTLEIGSYRHIEQILDTKYYASDTLVLATNDLIEWVRTGKVKYSYQGN